MKKIWLLFLLFFGYQIAFAGNIDKPKTTSYALLKKHLETKKGKKLNFLEKIALKIAVKKLRKDPRPIHKHAKVSLILGLVSYLLLYIFIANFIVGLIAIIFGIKALRKTEFRGKGIAIAGIILALFPVVLLLVLATCYVLDIFASINICGL